MLLYILTVIFAIGGFIIDPHVFIAFVMFLGISILTQTSLLYWHEHDINCIWELKENMKIQRRKCNELLEEFKLYLSDMYPKFEKEVFKSMTPEKVTAYMIKYPALESSETICKLVDLINSEKGDIYGYEINSIQKIRDVKNRVYSTKIWVFVTSKMKNDCKNLLMTINADANIVKLN